MTKIKVHIDTVKYNKKPKPKSKEYKILKPRLQNNNTIQEIELSELVKMIGQGYSISPAILLDGMRSNNWTEQSLFMIDIDNKNFPILTLNQALNICKDNNILPVFYYYTFSHTRKIPKYRLAFLMKEPITNTKLRKQLILNLINLFPQSDVACKNADRIFLGTNKKVIIYDESARISIDDILSLSNNKVIDTINNIKNDSELTQLKNNFNLLEYMCRDNEVSSITDKVTYFKNCSICGHNDCLRYYHNTNSFYCFGANGCSGGSIIDYLMLAEKLSLNEAIKKFKEELCDIDNNSTSCELEYITASELQQLDLPPIKFYVSNLIPQGLNLICSVPKLGKSWFALQLCLCITNGKSFLGFSTEQCSCLYFALEDSYNRIKDRTNKLLNGDKFPNNLHISISLNDKDINNGLIEELTKLVNQFPSIKIIVIDTLQKARGASKGNNAYANDYKELSKLKAFADKYNISIILIHHLKKGTENNDVFERVSGTNAIIGTADTTIILTKDDRNNIETKLSILGRDIDSNEYIIKFNKETCFWEMVSSSEDYNNFIERQIYYNNTLVKTIKLLVDENNNCWKGTLKTLNEEHRKRFHRVYSNSEIKLKHELDKIESQLMSYDNIVYIPSQYPTKEGRIQTFKRER